MPFQKNNEFGFRPSEEQPLDRKPLSIKLRQGVRGRLMQLPNWQTQLRSVIEEWVNSQSGSDEQV